MNENKQRDLTSAEQTKLLQDCENTIQDGVKQFLAVGQALGTIRDKKLYKLAGFKSFEVYCNERWSITRQYANRLIRTFRFNVEMETTVSNPINESRNRRFNKLPPEEHGGIKQVMRDGGDVEAAIAEAEQRHKSDYVKIAKYVHRIEILLTTLQTERQKIYELFQKSIGQWCKDHEANVIKMEQDADFDEAA